MSTYQFIPYYASACSRTRMHTRTHTESYTIWGPQTSSAQMVWECVFVCVCMCVCRHNKLEVCTTLACPHISSFHTMLVHVHAHACTHAHTQSLIPFEDRKPAGLKVNVAHMHWDCDGPKIHRTEFLDSGHITEIWCYHCCMTRSRVTSCFATTARTAWATSGSSSSGLQTSHQ